MRSFVVFLACAFCWEGALAAAREGIAWSRPIEVASGDAHRGPWRMNESDYRWVDDPSVALDEQGNIAIAWVDQARKDVLFQRYSASGEPLLGSSVNVSRSGEIFSWLPRVVINPRDPQQIHILWQEIVFSGGSHGGEIFFSRSDDGGKSFSRALNLSGTEAGDGKGRLTEKQWHNGSLDLAVGDDGVLYAAWTEYEGRLWITRSEDGGESFDEPQQVSGSFDTPARAPALAVDDDHVYLAWTVGESESANIHLSRAHRDALVFEAPQEIQPRKAHADAPKLAVDAQGVLHLVYGESASGIPGRYEIRYTRSRDNGRTFETSRTLSRATGNFPHLAVSGERVYVAWERYPDVGQPPRGLAFTWSEDGGDRFMPPEMLPGSEEAPGVNGGMQGLLMGKLAARHGAIAVVHSRFQENEASHVWLYRGVVR